jgi:flagellar motor switch protein FliN/FliY
MSDLHPAVANFFDQLTAQIQESLASVQDGATISWTAANPESRGDLRWWSCGISVDPGALLLAGAPEETWSALGRAYESTSDQPFENDFSGIVRSIQQVAQIHFGAEVECKSAGPSEEPARQLAEQPAAADVEISFHHGALTISMVLSTELVEALGGLADASEPPREGTNPVDRLLHIEVPVSVSLGRAEMRMKDVLALNSGSIVELEQELGDRVEVRVNNCVIARGEMVAVDGNYGVRILEMVSGQIVSPGMSPDISSGLSSNRGGA